MRSLKPFWRYYGGKWRAAPRYPEPQHGTIIEPFAGCAGYATRYATRDVILVEKYHKIAEIWRYLIRVSSYEIRQIPYVEHVDDLPGWVPEGGRWLVGFWMNSAATSPRQSLSTRSRNAGDGWTEATRERIAAQVDYIRHWRVIEDDWFRAPCIEATWFVDPPYNNKAGRHYIHNPDGVDFDLLARACRDAMPGQVIVCENEGASWLPFQSFATLNGNCGRKSAEVIWTNAA